MGQRHRTEKVKAPLEWTNGKDVHVDIDVMLIPMIRLMWELGIKTDECCQEPGDWCPPEYAVIWFDDIHQMEEFLKIVMTGRPDDLTTRMSVADTIWDNPLVSEDVKEKLWGFQCNPESVIVDDEQFFTIHSEMIFPQTDIDEVVKRLEGHLEGLQRVHVPDSPSLSKTVV